MTLWNLYCHLVCHIDCHLGQLQSTFLPYTNDWTSTINGTFLNHAIHVRILLASISLYTHDQFIHVLIHYMTLSDLMMKIVIFRWEQTSRTGNRQHSSLKNAQQNLKDDFTALRKQYSNIDSLVMWKMRQSTWLSTHYVKQSCFSNLKTLSFD